MCGICGILSLDGTKAPDVVEAMNAAQVHRGPDDEGAFFDGPLAFGMRRLSIIGLENGHQPIFNEDRSVAVVVNGEIYNYRELRDELEGRGHRFSTKSDIEVAVHLYEEVGADFIHRLRGMFGLALWDRKAGRLLIARDRPGKKPIYYAVVGGNLIFASEIKALHASGLVPKELNTTALRSYLSYGFVVGDGSLFKHVKRLPAGYFLRVSDGEIDLERYWDLPGIEGEVDPPTTDLDIAAAHLKGLLEKAVSKRLMSEVPLGAFLSGGVDSSAIVAVMRRHFDHPLQTFTVGFADARLDELDYARQVAEGFGTHHHELILQGANLALLRQINWFYDEPAGDPATLPTFCLSKFARQHITVALTGEGGDEIFAGYPHHRHCRRLGELEARLPGLRFAARALGMAEPLLPARVGKALWLAGMSPEERYRGWTAAFTDTEIHRLLRPTARKASPISTLSTPLAALHERVQDLDSLARLLYVDSRNVLADQLLLKVDKMGMAASLEARCPLLDQEFVEYGTSLPTSMKQSPEGSKRVFRKALRGLIPDDILDRKKQGFEVPLDTWFERDLRTLVEKALLDPRAALARHLQPGAVASMWQRYRKEPNSRRGLQLWRLVNLAVWHEMHWPEGLFAALGAEDEDPEVAMATLFVERRTTSTSTSTKAS
jgi:asparagine synthase (glutamine-hydrolysing)